MQNRLIYAFVIFIMLLTIPILSLSLLEKKMDLASVGNGILPENKDYIDITDTKSGEIIKKSGIKEPELIKIYNVKTNDVMIMDFEEYVKGVVASEMPAEFNIEALKAQAVTARTYLLYRLKKYPEGHPDHPGSSVCTGTHCQVWSSIDDLIASHNGGWYDNYWSKIENAVISTKGLILTYDNKIIEPLFHSTSGGRTENSEDVFAASVPYLRSVESPYENEAPRLHGSVKFNIDDFIKKIKSVYGDLNITKNNLKEKIILGQLSEGGKIKTVFIDNKEISGRELRTLFNLNSTNFSFIQSGDEIEIVTTGYGHGVGMSQWGADGMADEGYSYTEILKHYYTGVEIVSMK